MLDLYNNKYSREELKRNIYAVKLVDILKTQTLDYTFVARYILNPNYQLCEEDEKITVDLVLQFQPHLVKKRLLVHMSIYKADDDSVEKFDTHI
jgi:hypothetical protein